MIEIFQIEWFKKRYEKSEFFFLSPNLHVFTINPGEFSPEPGVGEGKVVCDENRIVAMLKPHVEAQRVMCFRISIFNVVFVVNNVTPGTFPLWISLGRLRH